MPWKCLFLIVLTSIIGCAILIPFSIQNIIGIGHLKKTINLLNESVQKHETSNNLSDGKIQQLEITNNQFNESIQQWQHRVEQLEAKSNS